MQKKLRVAILMGGPSAEYEVSLNTGEMVFKSLDEKKYQPTKIIISKKGKWPIALQDFKKKFDIGFNALHGEYGEDGTLQKILENIKIPYTGSNAKASKLGMNKIACYKLFKKAGLCSPAHTLSDDIKKIEKLGLPLVIKPADRGSSVGVSIIKNWQELSKAVKLSKKYSSKIIFEKYIQGREFTCGVVEKNNKIIPLIPTEIIPVNSHFFDYKAKYTAGASKEITPPNLSTTQIKKIQQNALLAHKIVGAKGYSRTDMILTEDGNLYVLEINTLPGMTKTSLLPQGAKATGITFPKLLDIIIRDGLRFKN